MLWFKVSMEGLRAGLSFIILITFSLAVLNLLPIPVLDGGHIVFALIEMVTRRRIPASFAHALQTAFAVLLIGFMLYVTFWDVGRLGRIIRIFSEKDTPPAEQPAEPGAE
jgi:regulator of sigma E protease